MITLARGRMRPRTDRPGQAIVEFALIAPILLLLVFGVIDFARAWSAHHTIADATREGLRMVIVHDEDVGVAEAEAEMQNRLALSGLDPSAATFEFNPADGVTARAEPLTLTVRYDFDFWLIGPLLGWISGQNTIELASRYTMRTE